MLVKTLKNIYKYRKVILVHLTDRLNLVVFLFSLLLVAIDRINEASITSVIVIFNILIAIYQEITSKEKLEKLNLSNTNTYKVTRVGVQLLLLQDKIVVKDIIDMGIGQQVPCDSVVVSGRVMVDEAFLTGESELIEKNTGDLLYAGSNVFSGSANIESFKEYSKSQIKELEKTGKIYTIKQTPIEQQISQFISTILFLIFCFVVVSTGYLFVNRITFQEIILTNSVISGLIPSTLLAMVTVIHTFAIGKAIIKKENLLPQRLNAFESLANVEVFCFDKTGTLTTNKMEYVDYQVNLKDFTKEDFVKYTSLFCKYTSAHSKSSETITSNFKNNYPDQVIVLYEEAFSSVNKYSSLTLLINDQKVILNLGSPDNLEFQDQIAKKAILNLQNKGLRVLVSTIDFGHGIKLLGYHVLKEELRKDILAVLNNLKDQQKDFKIISGDNPNSVRAVANTLGLNIKKNQIIAGQEIAKLSDKILLKKIKDLVIFGRMTPEDKKRVIGLIKQNKYVAMVGDGVNDLLPIKEANLGIALQSGASATRLASDLILLNDDYASLIRCISYGQVNKFMLSSLYNIFYIRFIYLSIIYLSLIFVLKDLFFSVIHTSLISLLGVGFGVFCLLYLSNKYQIKWKTYGLFELLFPSVFLTITLSLGLVSNMITIGFENSLVATSLVVFLVFCALAINILTVIPVDKTLFKTQWGFLLRVLVSQVLVFLLLLIIINIPFLAHIWDLIKLDSSSIIRILVFVIFWILGFGFVARFYRRG